MKTIKEVCAWCGVRLGQKKITERQYKEYKKRLGTSKIISHGVCQKCSSSTLQQNQGQKEEFKK